MASSTFLRVASEIGRLPLRTYETVLWETPAKRATSLLVKFGGTAFIELPFGIVDTHRRCASTKLAVFRHARNSRLRASRSGCSGGCRGAGTRRAICLCPVALAERRLPQRAGDQPGTRPGRVERLSGCSGLV